jgi:galactokinase
MGDHTDYNDGFVLPVAIDRDCLAAARVREDGVVRVRSLDVDPGESVVELPADGSADPAAVEPPWGRYVAALVRVLAESGRAPVGVEAVIASTVPPRAGLGSSAALEVACALALADSAGFSPPPRELALACQRAEQAATGVPCGIMDQLASLAGEPGRALLVDCRSLAVEPVPLPAGVAILVVHSGVSRALAESEYAERRAACEAIARHLGVAALRDARPDDVAERPLARHVVSENVRVLATAEALASGDVDALGALFAASHASLRDDYGASTPELDALVEALVEAGVFGARPTGAGFGGCVVALVGRSDAGRVADAACARYRAQTGREPTAFVCEAVGGAARWS